MWAEIRCDFVDDEGTIFIDAWKTPDGNEEGEVLAKVTRDGRVEYVNEHAKTNKKVEEVIKSVRFMQLANKTYGYYKADWCRERGYNMDDIDEEYGYRGECYACYDEFLDNEFRDEDYMKYLLNEKDFEDWKQLVR